MDDLTTHLLKRIDKMKKQISEDALNPLKYIEELEKWLIGDRSLQQHRACQAFMTFLWQSYGGDYKSRDGFVMRLKTMLGFADIVEKRFKDKTGKECRDRMIAVKSLSFAECTQKKHQEFFDKLKDFALKQWGVEFELWLEEYETNPDLIQ